MMSRRNPSVLCLLGFVLFSMIGLAMGCRGDDEPEQVEPDKPWEEVRCEDLILEADTAYPGTPLRIEGLVPGLEGLYAEVRVRAEDEPDFAFVRIRENDEGEELYELLAPLHPQNSIGGGDVRISLTDGDFACHGIELSIEALPSGPEVDGEFERWVDALQEFIDFKLAQKGFGRDVLIESHEETPLWILAMSAIQLSLDHPANPNSLRRLIASGEAVDGADTHEVDFALLDSVSFYLGLSSMLREEIDQQGELLSELGYQLLVPGANWNYRGAAVWEQPPIADAQTLDRMMVLSARHEFLLGDDFGTVLDGASSLMAVLAAKGNPVAAVGGVAFWMTKVNMEIDAKLLPSYFLRLEPRYLEPQHFNEDSEDIGHWDELVVDVRGETYFFTKTAIELVLNVTGALG
ncbi:MAG: hypothetical protein ACNA8W_26100, partial [Bradymonadaceae bacterium]